MVKLLLVDDEKGITDSLKSFFEQRGFAVDTAESGERAIEKVKKDKPDIVFLDIRMRGMGGLDALREIKKIDNNIKTIMLTMLEDKETVERAKSLGADEYITKPFKIDYLEKIVINKVQELMKERGSKG